MNTKRAKKDKKNREKGLERLQKRIQTGKLTKSNINNRGYNKYLKLEGKITISIDEEKFFADAAWDGIKGYVTNTRPSAGQKKMTLGVSLRKIGEANIQKISIHKPHKLLTISNLLLTNDD